MRTSKRFSVLGILVLVLVCMQACYYSTKTGRQKAHPSFLSEAEAESLIHKRFEAFGVKFVYNMRLIRDGVSFVADGYDRALRVGFEYRSHEGMDYEGEPGQNQDGLTNQEIGALRSREQPFREYFLIIPEGTRDQVNMNIDDFIKNLYAWEVLRKPKKPTSSKPKTNPSNAVPWENSNISGKLKEMEAREKLDQGKVDLKDEEPELKDLIEPKNKNTPQEEDFGVEPDKKNTPQEEDFGDDEEDFDF